MFKIGEFSKINMVTVRTLRHYEDVGLLVPEVTDRFTGYRYYSAEQLSAVSRILAFKRMGFSLAEIRRLLAGGAREEDLARKRSELLAEKRQVDERLAELDAYQKQLRGECDMQPIEIKKLPKVLSVSYRTVLNSYADLMELMPNKVGAEMQRLGLTCATPEYCFNRYHDGEYRETDIDVEICQSIVARGGESEILRYVEFAEVPQAATVRHVGPYETLGESYSRIFKWIEENGYEPAELAREWFIHGVWDCDDAKDWVTEIQVPIKKK